MATEVTAGSALNEERWAVIATHYVNLDLTYDEAMTDAAELRKRRQPGIVIVTSDAARLMIKAAAEARQPGGTDVRF